MAASKTAKKVEVELHDPKNMSKVVRYHNYEEGSPPPALTRIWLSNEAHAEIGKPDRVKVTIEPA